MVNPFAAARFLLSAADPAQLPAADRPEIAFAGRSNAGKSSALNAVCGRRALARVSRTPGRTRLLNFFELPAARLVDLPGYGYAEVPHSVRAGWGELVGGYVERRATLRGVVLVVDARHGLTDFDRQLLAWARAHRHPCHVLLTKSDKLGSNAARQALAHAQRELAALGGDGTAQLFSAKTGAGVVEARRVAAGWLEISSGAAVLAGAK